MREIASVASVHSLMPAQPHPGLTRDGNYAAGIYVRANDVRRSGRRLLDLGKALFILVCRMRGRR